MRLLLPMLAHLLDEPDPAAEHPDVSSASSSSDSSSSSSSGTSFLQTKASVLRASAQPAPVHGAAPPAYERLPPVGQTFRVSLAAALMQTACNHPASSPSFEDVCQARAVLAAMTAGIPFQPAYPSVCGLDLPVGTRKAIADCHPPWISLSDLPLGSSAWLYTDGSQCPEGCGWAVSISLWVPHFGWTWQGLLAASTRARYFAEESHDACDAEASALCAALSWALCLPQHVALHFCFDCSSAAWAACGEWSLPTGADGLPRPPHRAARSLHLLLEALSRSISYTFAATKARPGMNSSTVLPRLQPVLTVSKFVAGTRFCSCSTLRCCRGYGFSPLPNLLSLCLSWRISAMAQRALLSEQTSHVVKAHSTCCLLNVSSTASASLAPALRLRFCIWRLPVLSFCCHSGRHGGLCHLDCL